MNQSAFHELELQLQIRSSVEKVVETIVVTLILVIALVGNVLVCRAMYMNSTPRRVASYYVTALAISDICFACFVFPFVVGVSATGHWPFSDTSCQFQGFMSMSMAYASILTIALSAINRFFKVVKPSVYQKYYTPMKTILSIVAVWILSFVGALPHLLSGNKYVFHPGKMVCLFDLDNVSLSYTLVMATIYFAIPLAVMVFCYSRIIRVIRQYRNLFHSNIAVSKDLTLNRAELNVTKILFAVLIAFIICYIQIAVIDMIETLYKQFSQPRQIYFWYTTMAGSASCLNPIIYSAMNPTFRKDTCDFFKRCVTSYE